MFIKNLFLKIIVGFIILYPITAHANLPIFKIQDSIFCQEKGHAVEILEVYQSSGIENAGKIFQRLFNEATPDNMRKCFISGGTYLFLEEVEKIIIPLQAGDIYGIIVKVFDFRLEKQLYLIMVRPLSNQS
jgi:hypothetical protein